MLVAIIGGGQLGMMLTEAAAPLGIDIRVLDPSAEAPAARVAPLIVGAYDDRTALAELIDGADIVTYEFENVPVEAARWVAERVRVEPLPVALEAAQDRLAEKTLFERIGLPVPAFAPVDSLMDLVSALERIGTPAVLKTRRLGYDGKGQAVIGDPSGVQDAWDAVGGLPCILEAHVSFDRELSIIAVRGRDGATAFYPLVENHHRDGILRLTRAPAPGLTPHLQEKAEAHARALMEELGYIGVLAIELFQMGEDLLGNEFAPRVHNSGHWTIEGAATSQFDNHLRAITGMPLGPAHPLGESAMINLIGEASDVAAPGATLHLYGKQPRPGRKLGHVTVVAQDRAGIDERLRAVLATTGEH